MLHAAPGSGSSLPRPERLPVSTLVMVVLLAAGLVTFGLVFVLLALVLAGPVFAVGVAVTFALGSGLLLAHIVGALRARADR
jgi:hypothetical protein